MGNLTKQQRLWFEALDTGKYTQEQSPILSDSNRLKFNNGAFYCWMKSLILFSVSVFLFSFSFSSVWANPDETPPQNVLIPVDELMNKQEKESKHNQMNVSPSEPNHSVSDKQDTPDESELEQQLNQKQSHYDSKNDDEISQRIYPNSNPEVKKVEPQIPNQPSSSFTDEPNQEIHQKQSKTKSDYQTENGGKLPMTATPFAALFFRGLALILFGWGLRIIGNYYRGSII